ncbi:winged helix-turn-helix transcriptional regulator [Streptomyces sp. NPDC006335]|uniref:winged helix-turn-helix transcriptional regulator n=1 Tax=Streptomyces sp. NPDC006335 TaxID=3156895 RepID=UPI0033B30647
MVAGTAGTACSPGWWTTARRSRLPCWTDRPGRSRWRDALPGLSSEPLSSRLRRCVLSGRITRAAYPEVPPRVEYQLTPAGTRLQVVFGPWPAGLNRIFLAPLRPAVQTGDPKTPTALQVRALSPASRRAPGLAGRLESGGQ